MIDMFSSSQTYISTCRFTVGLDVIMKGFQTEGVLTCNTCLVMMCVARGSTNDRSNQTDAEVGGRASSSAVHWWSVTERLISLSTNAMLSRNITLNLRRRRGPGGGTRVLYREIKQCGRNGVAGKFLDKLTTQLHYTTRHKMDGESSPAIMFCFPNCNLFEGFNGCRIKTSRALVRFHWLSAGRDWWVSLLAGSAHLLPSPRLRLLGGFAGHFQH